jgi:hypothetical protein
MAHWIEETAEGRVPAIVNSCHRMKAVAVGHTLEYIGEDEILRRSLAVSFPCRAPTSAVVSSAVTKRRVHSNAPCTAGALYTYRWLQPIVFASAKAADRQVHKTMPSNDSNSTCQR